MWMYISLATSSVQIDWSNVGWDDVHVDFTETVVFYITPVSIHPFATSEMRYSLIAPSEMVQPSVKWVYRYGRQCSGGR